MARVPMVRIGRVLVATLGDEVDDAGALELQDDVGRRVVGQLRISVLGGVRSARPRTERLHMGVDDGPAGDEDALECDGALLAGFSEEVRTGGQLHEGVERRDRSRMELAGQRVRRGAPRLDRGAGPA